MYELMLDIVLSLPETLALKNASEDPQHFLNMLTANDWILGEDFRTQSFQRWIDVNRSEAEWLGKADNPEYTYNRAKTVWLADALPMVLYSIHVKRCIQLKNILPEEMIGKNWDTIVIGFSNGWATLQTASSGGGMIVVGGEVRSTNVYQVYSYPVQLSADREVTYQHMDGEVKNMIHFNVRN